MLFISIEIHVLVSVVSDLNAPMLLANCCESQYFAVRKTALWGFESFVSAMCLISCLLNVCVCFFFLISMLVC